MARLVTCTEALMNQQQFQQAAQAVSAEAFCEAGITYYYGDGDSVSLRHWIRPCLLHKQDMNQPGFTVLKRKTSIIPVSAEKYVW